MPPPLGRWPRRSSGGFAARAVQSRECVRSSICRVVARQQQPHARCPANAALLAPDLRIDGTTNDLTFITGISVRRSGEIFIAQPHDNSIKVFSSIGVPVRTIGRKGEGPGELTGLGNIGFVGDTLYATDFRQRRVILFTHDGRVVRTIKMSPMNVEALKRDTMASRYRGPIPMGLSANNTALAIPSVSSSDMAEGRIVALPVLRVGWDGAPQKRLALLPRAYGTLGITYGAVCCRIGRSFSQDHPNRRHQSRRRYHWRSARSRSSCPSVVRRCARRNPVTGLSSSLTSSPPHGAP